MNVYIVTAIIFIFYLVLAWVAGALLRLHGTSLWLLRGVLTLIGMAATGLFLWYHHRLKRGMSVAHAPSAALADQIRILLRQADDKLKAAKQGSMGSLPIVFILGDSNSAKTSAVVHSGLEPELIAGHVLQDGDIVPTASINIWFARKVLLIEVGGKLASSPQLWAQVLRQTRPKQLSVALGKGELAPRAALVCFDSERLTSSQNSVQTLAGRLKEMARSLGAPYPVYVLFAKLDRMPHFKDFVAHLTADESAQVLGVTLPRLNTQGVFAEVESKRLSKAFDQIIYSLAEKRLDFLSRETVADRFPGVYEFPREIRKSRNQVVQLLLDLTRPTQLSANPFLRGFYFSGVRAIVINEAVSVAAMAPRAAVSGSGATRMFNFRDDAPVAAENVAPRSVQSRKVPEWTFLPHLFSEIILRDRAAFSGGRQSTKVDVLRRLALAFAAVTILFFAIALLASFISNRILESDVSGNAARLAAVSSGVVDTPNMDQLTRLEQLRVPVATLKQYQTDGPPLHYRFGLYSGDRIYPAARSIYFRSFRRLLLLPTQQKMVAILGQPPSTKSSDDFQQMYFTLKAYLITTRNHEHGDWNSFVSVLLDHCPTYNTADAEAKEIIRKQFAFYAGELVEENPFGPENDTTAVERARAYLKQFDGADAIYQAMLDDAAKGNKPLNFNRRFPGSTLVLIDPYEVPAAFSKDGFTVMQKSLQNPGKFRGEDWVLGSSAALNTSVESVRDLLTTRYFSEYEDHWRRYLKSAHVVGYSNLKDASLKLSKLSANDSPLLQLLWLAKENTAVEVPDIRNPFDAVQATARDSTLEKLVGPGNQDYMGALATLQYAVQNTVNTPNGASDPALLSQVQQAASNASGAVGRLQQRFTIDTQGVDKVDKNVSRLLQEPIDSINQAAQRAGGAPAETVCSVVNSVTGKWPFNARSSQRATVQEVQDLFLPQQGTLWTLVQGKLGPVVSRTGTKFINVGSPPQSGNFLAFLDRALQFTDALFPNSSRTMHLTYTLRQLPSSGIDQASLVIDGQTLAEAGRPQQFVWQGSDSSAISLSATASGQKLRPITSQGPWAPFDFFGGADWKGNNPATLEWPVQAQVQFGHHPVSESSTSAVRYELTTQGAQVFSKEFLRSLHCSSR